MLLAWASVGLGMVLIILTASTSALWQRRAYMAEAAYACVIGSALFVIADVPRLGLLPLSFYAIAGAIVCFLAARIQYGRLPEAFLRQNTMRSAAAVLAGFTVLPLAWQLIAGTVYAEAVIAGIMVAALSLACLLAAQTAWGLRHYTDRRKQPAGYGPHPSTVTLAIPARNETHALAHCLDAAVRSSYPRLEILVLDDCSQDSTSQLIRSFAHGGVRFVQGDEPAKGWLGKNSAYATLLKEATGEYIFFMGVDTHLEPEAITHLVSYADKKGLDMVSVLPRQRHDYLFPLLMQHMRYVWQIALPLGPRRVPVSAESWLVKRSALLAAGGFETVKHEIVPEASLAKQFAAKNRYRFIVADKMVPISYGKRWSSQTETATRLWYPLCKRQPFTAIGLAVCLLTFGLVPFFALFTDILYIQLLAATTCLLYLGSYAAIMHRLQPRTWWLSMWLLPLVIIQEAVTLLASMAKYEFMDVDWKGRNVCYPVLLHRRT